jgi:uncharacterized surface protein with fasciclin (FAS1) repeats
VNCELNNQTTTSQKQPARSRVAQALAATVALSLGIAMTACSSDSTDVAPTTTVVIPGQSTTTIAVTLPPYVSPMSDIVGEALTAGVFTTLAGLLVDAGLVQALRAPGPFTVFAPTDDAFATVPAATMDAVFADPALLAAVLTFHVVAGQNLTLAEMPDGTVLTTLQGNTLTITKKSDKTYVNDIEIVAGDVPATNGTIHVISGVLVPG